MRYSVHVRQDWIYQVDGDTSEEAADAFDYDPGSCGAGECTGYSIEAVTTLDDMFGDDLRQPKPCHGGCGKAMPASHLGECLDCMLKRLAAERAARMVGNQT